MDPEWFNYVLKNFINQKIIDEVNESKYFNIIFDETPDVNHTL